MTSLVLIWLALLVNAKHELSRGSALARKNLTLGDIALTGLMALGAWGTISGIFIGVKYLWNL